ncbi:hypothetical protein BD626DRAFT_564308 [Schizophyllum amplum]|uniref:Uncharacterized protein n=1 Tax=Schizophyllum amplum TaxID=97359 RepID=A0A550CRC8_9AGAR|nr:hypothetical protein BD626DRAFT_564308 [Auriculariopsis ampla]
MDAELADMGTRLPTWPPTLRLGRRARRLELPLFDLDSHSSTWTPARRLGLPLADLDSRSTTWTSSLTPCLHARSCAAPASHALHDGTLHDDGALLHDGASPDDGALLHDGPLFHDGALHDTSTTPSPRPVVGKSLLGCATLRLAPSASWSPAVVLTVSQDHLCIDAVDVICSWMLTVRPLSLATCCSRELTAMMIELTAMMIGHFNCLVSAIPCHPNTLFVGARSIILVVAK